MARWCPEITGRFAVFTRMGVEPPVARGFSSALKNFGIGRQGAGSTKHWPFVDTRHHMTSHLANDDLPETTDPSVAYAHRPQPGQFIAIKTREALSAANKGSA